MTELDIDATIAGLTLEEKASLCSGSDFWHTEGIDRADISPLLLSDGPHGLRKQATAADHVGLGESVPATCFPPAVGLGSSWNRQLVKRVGEALGAEARAAEIAVLLGPGINIKRSPLCGRNFEYFSEDPLVSGELGAALVRGIQRQGVGASVKHYAANNQETDRMRVSAEVDERTLREIYLAGFERVVATAKPWTVMCSYNKINGTYASEHPWLLTTVLRDEWGFDGLVMSDWGAVNDRVAGLAAGLDLEMPSSDGVLDRDIVAAVRAGRLDETVLDVAVRRLLQLHERTRGARTEGGSYDRDEHHELSRVTARECAVLLKNDPVDGAPLLPLDPAADLPVVVIGEFARTPRYQGAGSSQVNPTRVSNALDELRTLAGSSLRIDFAPGYLIDATPDDAAAGEGLAAEATVLAAAADTVLLFLGLPPSYESEGWDRDDMDLPAEQLDLLRAVVDANPRVVVVLSNGAAVTVADWAERVPAILEGWLLGQGGGAALADLLFGVANPSGRLTETIPWRLADNPSFGNFPGEFGVVRYGEGVLVGYRSYDARDVAVAYPFGHGLSYTSFEYGPMTAIVSGSGAGAHISVSLTVTNTGKRPGQEVVQLYVGDLESSVLRPVRELRGFAKVPVDAGATAPISFTLSARDLAFWHPVLRRWVVEGGEFEIAVGASSRDIRQRAVVTVIGEPTELPLTADSTLAEWLADPTAREALESVAPSDFGPLGISAEMVKLMGSIPMIRLARFPLTPIGPDDLDPLIAKLNPSG
jgi:beta-glucosidase